MALALLLNLGYLYNTLIWEQVDAIYTLFAFGAVVLAARQRNTGSVLCFVLALAAKTQAIIFLPPLLLLWAPRWWQRPSQLVRAALAGGTLATLLLAPFIWGGRANSLPRIIEINLNAAHTFPVASMNAYNLWQLLLYPVNPMKVTDTLPFAGLTYRQWGLLLFGAASALALLPLLGRAAYAARPSPAAPTPPLLSAAGERDQDLGLVLLSCGLIPLLFCFFNTQMHERYWHAAVLFLAAYGFVRRDYLPYILASVAYFLNLEGVLSFTGLLNFSADSIRYKPHVTAVLFAGLIVLCFVKLYQLATLAAKSAAGRCQGTDVVTSL